MTRARIAWALVFIAIVLKSALFVYAARVVPQSKFQPDTELYLNTGLTLAREGVLARRSGLIFSVMKISGRRDIRCFWELFMEF